MRDHTDCSHFYPTKCNFPKKSLDTSIPQFFPQTLLKFPISGQIPQKWDPWLRGCNNIPSFLQWTAPIAHTFCEGCTCGACATRLCSHTFSVTLNPETSMALTYVVVGAFSAPDDSAKESSYIHVHGSHLHVSLAWSFLSPCFGRLCLYVAVSLAWLLHLAQPSHPGQSTTLLWLERPCSKSAKLYSHCGSKQQ